MRPRRLRTFDYIGCYHYSLTFCTYRRRRYFEDRVLAGLVEEQLSRTSIERAFASLAYCYMPDHVHLVLAGLHDGASLLPCVEVMRQRSTRVSTASRGIRLWQDGYFERVLRDDEQLEVVARYVFENPVRAGLTGPRQQMVWQRRAVLGAARWFARAKARPCVRSWVARAKARAYMRSQAHQEMTGAVQ